MLIKKYINGLILAVYTYMLHIKNVVTIRNHAFFDTSDRRKRMKQKKRMNLGLTARVMIGFSIGVLLGILFHEKIKIIEPLGTLFLRLVKMVVVPMIFFSIVTGITSMSDIKKLKRIGLKTLGFYCMTTVCAACIGLVAANYVHPGNGFDLSKILVTETYEKTELPSVGETVLEMFPDNVVNAMAEGNLMQVIVFAVFVGIAIVVLEDQMERVNRAFQSGSRIMFKITDMVMQFSPIGVCALMACTVGEYGLSVFGPLAKFILCVFGAQLLVLLTVYSPMLKFAAKVPLKEFYKKMIPVWLMTISTASSTGTLPLTTETAEKEFGVSSKLTGFTLPLGATVNMDGAVVFYAVSAVFVSQIYGVNMSIGQQITLVLLTTMVSVGCPGIPGGAIVMLTMLLSNMGLPLDIVGMLAGINRIIDMGDTSLNVTGDMVGTLCIARSEKLLGEVSEEKMSEGEEIEEILENFNVMPD